MWTSITISKYICTTISLDITGGSVVNNLYIGKSGGQLIGTNGNDTKVDVDLYLGATVNMPNPNEFQNFSVTQYVFVTIDDNRFELNLSTVNTL